jgi:hypothetical protein
MCTPRSRARSATAGSAGYSSASTPRGSASRDRAR